MASVYETRRLHNETRAEVRTVRERLQARIDQLDPYTRALVERRWRLDDITVVKPANDKSE